MTGIWKWLKRVWMALLLLVFSVVGLTWLAGALAKARMAKEALPPGQLVAVSGTRMHLLCSGEGSPTVILDAGLNDFHIHWAKVQPAVAASTRVCSYDRAGLGWSEASPRPRTNDVMVEELHALLANAGVGGPYILVGHSFGGINARRFAQRYPDEVAGIVLVDSAHEEQIARLPFLKAAADQFVRQFRTYSTLSSLGLIALSPGSIPNVGLPDQAYKQYQVVLSTRAYFDGASAETSTFYAKPQGKPAPLGDLPLIVLTHGLPDSSIGVTGAEKEIFEQEWAKMQTELLSLSSNSKQVIADQSGHYIQLDQPDLVIDSILALLPGSQQ